MAFSTQKDFFKINFLNAEPEEPLKKRSDAAIKNYESVTDARAWSSNQQDRSRFLVETVQRNSASNGSADIKAQGEPIVLKRNNDSSTETTKPQIFPQDNGIEKEERASSISRLTTAELVSQIDNLTQTLKKKDSELNKIRRTFKRKSREAVDIESIVNEKEIIKSQLKEAEVKIGELADSNESKEEALEHLKNKLKNMSNSNKQLQRRLSTISEDIDLDNCQLTGRTQMLEEVTKERDLLKRQLKDLAGLEALLKQLKKRAERSFLLENENEDLIKELNVLLLENQRKPETDADRNFFGEQMHVVTALEAELLVYKVKYNEMAQNNRQMKEQLLQADNDQRKLLDYERMKSTLEKELDISDHHIGELIDTVINQDRYLKAKDDYISSVNQKLRSIDDDVQSIQVLLMPIQDYLVEGLNEEVQRNDHVLLEQTDDSQAMNIELEIRLNLEKEVDELKLVIEKLIAEKASHEDKNLKTVSAEVIEPLFRKIMPEEKDNLANLDENLDQLNESFELDDVSSKFDDENSMLKNENSMLMDENFKLQNELNVLHHQLADIMAITDSIEIEREANFCVKNDVEALQIKFQELTQKIPESFEDNKDIVMIAHRHSEKSHREDQLEQKHHEIFNDQKDIKIAELEKLLTENHQEFLKNQERVELVESLQSQVDQLNSRIQLCHVMEQQNIDKILDLEKMVTACQEKNAALNQKQLDSVENLQKLKEIEKDFMDNKERALELEKINKSLEDDLSAKSRTISMTSATMRESIEHIKNCIEDHCNDKVKLLKTWIEELQSENEKLKSFRQKVLNKRPCECHSVTMGSKLDMICHKILICGLGSLQFDELFYLYNELYLVIVKIKDVDSMGGFSGASIFDKTEEGSYSQLENASTICNKINPKTRHIDICEVTHDCEAPKTLSDQDGFNLNLATASEKTLIKNINNRSRSQSPKKFRPVTFIEASFQSGNVPPKTIKLRSHSCRNSKKKRWI